MATIQTAQDIVREDLDFICAQLQDEFQELRKKKVLLIGGAGFLGYYLVQALLHQNTKVAAGNELNLTVFDNFMRGVPDWLTDLQADLNLKLVKHDITQPLPEEMAAFDYIIHAASIA